MRQSIPTSVLIATALSCLPAIASEGQVLSEWLNPVDGDWSDPLNWSTPDAPSNGGGTTYDARIAAGGVTTYTVNYNLPGISIDTLILDDAHARLQLSGTLVAGLIDVRSGELLPLYGGIRDATLMSSTQSRLTITQESLTLDNVTIGSETLFMGTSEHISIENALSIADSTALLSSSLLQMIDGAIVSSLGQSRYIS